MSKGSRTAKARTKKKPKARHKGHVNGAKAAAPPKHAKPRREEVPAILRRFAHYLKRRRGEQQLSIRDFAGQIGIPFSNLFQFERLIKNPRLTELEMLAKGLGESLPLFMERVMAPDDSEPRTNVSIV